MFIAISKDRGEKNERKKKHILWENQYPEGSNHVVDEQLYGEYTWTFIYAARVKKMRRHSFIDLRQTAVYNIYLLYLLRWKMFTNNWAYVMLTA